MRASTSASTAALAGHYFLALAEPNFFMSPVPPVLQQFFAQNGLSAVSVIEDAVSLFEERETGRGDFFLREGKVANAYMVLESGFLRAFTYNTEGDEVTTAFYSPGSVVFEVASFFRRIPSQENIQALTDSRGWVLTFEQLNHLFHAHVAFREFGRTVLVKGFAALKERMLTQITETAEGRYLSLLQQKPAIFQQAPLKYIASYLGITDTSLSRLRKELTKKEQ